MQASGQFQLAIVTHGIMPTVINVRHRRPDDEAWGMRILEEEWHGPLIERADEFVDAGALPWLVAEWNGQLAGFASLLYGPDFIEIITLKSVIERNGVGSALISATVELATEKSMNDVRLFTTNDNIKALEFYQKRGFRLHALHVGTMTRARILKPSIPLFAANGIEVRDEIELRIALSSSAV